MADMPQEGNERPTHKERILLPKEKYFDTKVHEIETVRLEETKDKELQDESARDEPIQKSKKGHGPRKQRNERKIPRTMLVERQIPMASRKDLGSKRRRNKGGPYTIISKNGPCV